MLKNDEDTEILTWFRSNHRGCYTKNAFLKILQ